MVCMLWRFSLLAFPFLQLQRTPDECLIQYSLFLLIFVLMVYIAAGNAGIADWYSEWIQSFNSHDRFPCNIFLKNHSWQSPVCPFSVEIAVAWVISERVQILFSSKQSSVKSPALRWNQEKALLGYEKTYWTVKLVQHTVQWGGRQHPSIPLGQHVHKGTLVQTEARFLYWRWIEAHLPLASSIVFWDDAESISLSSLAPLSSTLFVVAWSLTWLDLSIQAFTMTVHCHVFQWVL